MNTQSIDSHSLADRARAFYSPFLPAEAKTLLTDMACAIDGLEARVQALHDTIQTLKVNP